jgi:hypothetical protein
MEDGCGRNQSLAGIAMSLPITPTRGRIYSPVQKTGMGNPLRAVFVKKYPPLRQKKKGSKNGSLSLFFREI